jgi:hypothetical protein
MTAQTCFVQPPRIATWFLNLCTPGGEEESILGDLVEEYSHLASKSGIAFARHWYCRQTAKTIAHLAARGFRVAPWSSAVAVIGGFLLNRLVSGLPERAIFAVLHRYQVFDRHFSAYVFFATDGVAIGHVIVSMFVGCAVALAAKGKEMLTTMTLGLVLCAMTGVAALVWVSTGQAVILWMLPWYVADWLAIVFGGAVVRTRRLAATTRASKA